MEKKDIDKLVDAIMRAIPNAEPSSEENDDAKTSAKVSAKIVGDNVEVEIEGDIKQRYHMYEALLNNVLIRTEILAMIGSKIIAMNKAESSVLLKS